MSLTSLIQEENVKQFFQAVIPKKSEFKTISGCAPFSREYDEKVPYKLSNSYYSGLVGTAFDYIARWLIARNTKINREDSYTNIIAEDGMLICQSEAHRNEIDIRAYYEKGLDCCRRFMSGEDNKDELIEVAIFFAKLEQVWRRQLRPFQVDINSLLVVEQEVYDDLLLLSDVFNEQMIESGIVKNSSEVVYNPTFGGASVICGGADADIFIDGTLYDFKCTKRFGYAWREVAQLFGYYLLDKIAKKNCDLDNDLNEYEIRRIAIYRARFGEVEYYDLNLFDYSQSICRFETLLGEDSYFQYFEAEKIRRDEERLKELAEKEEYIKTARKYRKCMQLLNYTEDANLSTIVDEDAELSWMRCGLYVRYNMRIRGKLDYKKLQMLMETKKVDIKELSVLLNKTPSTIRSWLQGKRTPTLGVILEMTEILECQVYDLVKKEKVKK